jgi:hypothetical protein
MTCRGESLTRIAFRAFNPGSGGKSQNFHIFSWHKPPLVPTVGKPICLQSELRNVP